jgi:predicted nicotinamide N-methyase
MSLSCAFDHYVGLGIWPASILMARMVIANKDIMRNKVVVELGAGCGLPSIAAGECVCLC